MSEHRTRGNVINMVIGIVALIIALFIAGYLIYKFAQLFQGETGRAIAAAAATALISTFSIIVAKQYERKSVLLDKLREKKTPIYEDYAAFWIKYFVGYKPNKKQPIDDSIIKFLEDFTHRIIVWGSDDVLKAYSDFRKFTLEIKTEDDQKKFIIMFEALLLKVRKDLGHKNKDISSGDILSLFINDVKNLIPAP